jgi:hypothetical protein
LIPASVFDGLDERIAVNKRRANTMKILLIIAVWFAGFCHAAETAPPPQLPVLPESRWWPTQALPKGLVRIEKWDDRAGPRASVDMMVQSLAGLAAKSVNEKRGDEMVWIGTDNTDVEDWLARRLKTHPQLETRGVVDPWTLVERYAQRGIIKGYILYRADSSKGALNEHRPGMDCSVNVATSLAGLLDGIVVDETLEPKAQQHGLKALLDVRNRNQAWCFETYKDRFAPTMVCTQDPLKPHTRDLAIAHKAFTCYGYEAPALDVMKWLTPLAPVLGWNGGDEFKTTEISSRWGHLQTATDWCINLPVLMAATETIEPARAKGLNPRTIDWHDTRSAVSFISSDGDNVQWFEGSFFRGSSGQSYWGNPERGKIPFGWSGCFAQLTQLCPEAIAYAVSTQSPNDQWIEWGGGYYFPDLFAVDRSERWELLARHARRTWALMQKNNTRIIGFNVAKADSPDARKAYEIFAGQTDGLLGILVFQYDAYEAAAGKVFWVKDRSGLELPVISARYSIWNQANRARAGTPAKVAREIRQTVENTPPDELPRYDWVIAHVWSWFKAAPGSDERAEEVPHDDALPEGAVRGYLPATWCAARLPSNIRTVTPEELVWRLRMKHNSAQTRQLMANWAP